VTYILFQHFHVDDAGESPRFTVLDSRTNFDTIFQPLLLQWSRLHTASLQSFLRIWKTTGAELEDFEKVAELIRVLVGEVVGRAPRTKDIQDVEEDLQEYDVAKLREAQMELLEQSYESAWGIHLRQVREELKHEALQFVKEQRIRCLLQGAWFSNHAQYNPEKGPITKQDLKRSVPASWRYVRLSHNRRFLHYGDFETHDDSYTPSLDLLVQKIDLNTVSSVVSNVSAASIHSNSSTETLTANQPKNASTTKITIHGNTPGSSHESILLSLSPSSHSVASEWLDGLLMLLNQQPITAETTKLTTMVTNYGIKIRLLNVRYGDQYETEPPPVPTREGLDEDYYYEVFGGL
jgi:engulfment and cell motility protein 1